MLRRWYKWKWGGYGLKYGLENFENVVIESTVNGRPVISIESDAFYCSNFDSLTIPASIVEIAPYGLCNSGAYGKEIGVIRFSDDSKLKKLGKCAILHVLERFLE